MADIKSKSVKVLATNDGWYHGRRIRKGVCFVLRDGDKVGSWMQVVEDVPVTVATPVAHGQTTISEIARGSASVDPMTAMKQSASSRKQGAANQ